MPGRRAFTLLEIIVVLVILGLMAAIAVPALFVSVEQTRAQAAKNNLLAISAAQQKYFEDRGGYCVPTNNSCGNTQANLFSSLSLDMTASDPFNYSCVAGSPYLCTASDSHATLTTTGSGVNCTVGGSYCPS